MHQIRWFCGGVPGGQNTDWPAGMVKLPAPFTVTALEKPHEIVAAALALAMKSVAHCGGNPVAASTGFGTISTARSSRWCRYCREIPGDVGVVDHLGVRRAARRGQRGANQKQCKLAFAHADHPFFWWLRAVALDCVRFALWRYAVGWAAW